MKKNYKIRLVLILGLLMAFGGCSSGDDDNSDPMGGGVTIPPDPSNPPKDDKDKDDDKKEYEEYDFSKSRVGDPHLYEFEVTGGSMDGQTFSGEITNKLGESYGKNKDLEHSNMHVVIDIKDEAFSFKANAFLGSQRVNEDFGEDIPLDNGKSVLTIKMDDGETASFINPSGVYSIRNIAYQELCTDEEQEIVGEGFKLSRLEYRFDAYFEDETQDGEVVHLFGRIICQSPLYTHTSRCNY